MGIEPYIWYLCMIQYVWYMSKHYIQFLADSLRVANDDGDCLCSYKSVEIQGICRPLLLILCALFIPLTAVAAVAGYFMYKRQLLKGKQMWIIEIKELVFPDPPVVRVCVRIHSIYRYI